MIGPSDPIINRQPFDDAKDARNFGLCPRVDVVVAPQDSSSSIRLRSPLTLVLTLAAVRGLSAATSSKSDTLVVGSVMAEVWVGVVAGVKGSLVGIVDRPVGFRVGDSPVR